MPKRIEFRPLSHSDGVFTVWVETVREEGDPTWHDLVELSTICAWGDPVQSTTLEINDVRLLLPILRDWLGEADYEGGAQWAEQVLERQLEGDVGAHLDAADSASHPGASTRRGHADILDMT